MLSVSILFEGTKNFLNTASSSDFANFRDRILNTNMACDKGCAFNDKNLFQQNTNFPSGVLKLKLSFQQSVNSDT